MFVYAKSPAGDEYFSGPVDDVFDSFRQFYYLRVSPTAESVEARHILEEAEQAYRRRQFEQALSYFERAFERFPLFSVTHSPSVKNPKAKAEAYFSKSILLDKDDIDASKAYAKRLHRHRMYRQPLRYFVKEPLKKCLGKLGLNHSLGRIRA